MLISERVLVLRISISVSISVSASDLCIMSPMFMVTSALFLVLHNHGVENHEVVEIFDPNNISIVNETLHSNMQYLKI